MAWISNIFKMHHGFFTLTNGYCVVKARSFFIDSGTWKKIILQLLAFGASHRAIHKDDLA